ncbi:hypothetical protein [Bradyrhizobium sp. STM 3843]|uniref:peptidoglycan-binding domain-containing protein n=1 Tax=Bradyrhizobium sp. STM 3843 TaxID=551947 RepID=UPI001111C45B|nr:hypothetical protein [Bradyrhizobium sp. STM 3843]
MGVLISDELKDDPKLDACATTPSAHLKVGSPPGPHILKVQLALERLRPTGPKIDDAEKRAMRYGPTTAAAVLNYKKTHVPPIINTAYQHDVDPICGQMTIKAMDADLNGTPLSDREAVADRAHEASRAALRVALTHLRSLRTDINLLPSSSDPAFGAAMVNLLFKHKRNIAVLARRLVLTPDPNSQAFKDALAKVILLCERNLAQAKTIKVAGTTGFCAGHPGDHARTSASVPDPKTHLCEIFFTNDGLDLQRDVITHEYFHIQGLGDNSVTNTAQAFTNANTIAQIVALLADRFRQRNSDGGEPAVPPLPAP